MLIIVWLAQLIESKELFTNTDLCPDGIIGDGICDPACMFPTRSYDSVSTASDNFSKFIVSDCAIKCMDFSCDIQSMNSTVCMDSCNHVECGWNLGACGYCGFDCTTEMLKSASGEEVCNTSQCRYDNGYYGWCAPGCTQEMLDSNIFAPACNNSACDYQNGLGINYYCSPGCSIISLSNAYCDDVCNNEACNYDNNMCLCAPHCTDLMMASDTCLLDDPCNVEACGFKNGKCGTCAQGCGIDQIGDGNCNEECNNEPCSYDNGDCSCAPNCPSSYANGIWTWGGGCSIECLVEACLFNYGGCTNTGKIITGILNNIVNEKYDTFNYNVSACTLDQLATFNLDNQCSKDDPCNTSESFYCNGFASPVPMDCYLMNGNTCLFNSNTQYFYGNPPVKTVMEIIITITYPQEIYSSVANINAIFGNGIEIKFLNAGLYKKTNPYTITLDPTLQLNNMSLSDSLASAIAPYTIINLPQGNYTYKEVTPLYNYFYIKYSSDPLSVIPFGAPKELAIQGSSSALPVVFFQSGMTLTYLTATIYIKNVIFSGEQLLKVSCTADTCFYCPYVYMPFEGVALTDSFVMVMQQDLQNYVMPCLTAASTIYFNLNTAYLDGVTFINFRTQFAGLLQVSNNLVINNSNFTKIQPGKGRSMISTSCSSNCTYVTIEMQNVVVTDFNYGYQHISSIQQGYFLAADSIGSVLLDKVTFSYCMAFSCATCPTDSFLNIINLQGTFTIQNCIFENIYTNTLIEFDSTSISYVDSTLDKYYSRKELSQVHFSIINTTFENIYASSSVIAIAMDFFKQNVNITNCSFNNVVAGSEMILIDSTRASSTDESQGEWSYLTLGPERYYYYKPPRYFIISNVTMNSIKYSGNIFQILYYPNIIIDQFSVTNSDDGTLDDPYIYVIENFIKAGKYLNVNPSESLLISKYCNTIISMNNFYYTLINSVTVSNNSCNTLHTSYISLSVGANATIINFSASLASQFSFDGLALDINEVNVLNIDSIDVYLLDNSYSSVLNIESSKNITLSNIYFNTVSAGYAPPMALSLVDQVSITNITFLNCSSLNSDGGAIKLLMSNNSYEFSMSAGTFTDCLSSNGQGSVIYIDTVSSTLFLKLNMQSIRIDRSISMNGVIYIARNVQISQGYIGELSITNSDSKLGAIIIDYHIAGTLTIDSFFSSGNNAPYSSIYGSYSSQGSTLVLRNAILNKDSARSAVFCFSSINPATFINFTNVTVENISNSGIELDRVSFAGDTLLLDTLLKGLQISNSFAFLNNTIFRSIKSNAVYLSSGSVNCNNCTFVSCTDTLIKGDASAYMNIIDSMFIGTISTDVMVLDVSASDLSTSSFRNCIFANNTSTTQGLFRLQLAFVSMTNCTIFNNTSSGTISSGIILYASMLSLSNCSFSNQNLNYITSFLSSVVSISDTSFSNCDSTIPGAAIYASSSKISITQSAFEKITTTQYGAALYLDSSPLTMNYTSFQFNKALAGDSIYSLSSSMNILDCEFYNFSNQLAQLGSIYFDSANLYIENSNFSNTIMPSSGIYGSSIGSLKVISCSFSSITSENGSGISILNTRGNNSMLISNSIFSNNNATSQGGAIYSAGVDLTISNTIIYNNTAGSDGGGINFSSPTCVNCNFSISGSTNITFNRCAAGSGGGIKWEDRKPEVENSVIIQNNSAPYGGNYASYAVTMGVPSGSGRRLSELYVATLDNVAPGQMYNNSLIISLLDSYGNIVTTDNLSTATLSPYSNTVNVITSQKYVCSSGNFTLTNFTLDAQPGTTQYINLATTAIDVSKQNTSGDNVTYTSTVQIKVNFRNCTYGEQNSSDTCIVCPSLKYLIEPEDTCKICPTGALCSGGSSILPLPGYWRVNNYSEVVYACPVSSACLGSLNSSDYSGTCAAGYKGNMCGTCEIGYSLSSSGKCSACPSTEINILILLLLSGLIVLVGVVMVKSTLQSAFSAKSLYSIYIKIFTNYLQIVFLTAQFNLNWPETVIELFSIQKSAATASDQIFSLDCYFSESTNTDTETVYYYKLIIMAILPLIIWSISFIVWLFISFVKENNDYLKRELITTMIVLFFLVHPNIVKVIFGSMACESIDGTGYWLIDSLDIPCWTYKHIQMVLLVSLPSILLWVLFVPLTVFIIMLKRRKLLTTDYNRVVFGFLFNGYKSDTFFWEFVILYRKILMICVSVFLNQVSTMVQALTIIFVLFIALYLQYSLKPYKIKQLNFMELEAVTTATLTIYCGLYYLSGGIGEYLQTLLFVFILGGNLYFIAYWLYYMSQAIFDIILNFIPYLKKYFKRGDAFTENFYEEGISVPGTYFDKSEGVRKFTFLSPKTKELSTTLDGINTLDDVYKVIMRNNSRRPTTAIELSDLGS